VRKRTISVALIVASLILIMAAPQRGQTALGQSSDNARARRSVAIDTLRAINAVEYAYRFTHGTFASWDVLAVSEEFSGRRYFTVQSAPQLADAYFAKRPEILPGWTLRLNVTSDGKGYDVLLEDKTDKACGYAAITNETGLIRQSKTLDCDI
jgi:hypothetical protein